MKKLHLIISIAICVLLIFSLSACNGGSKNGKNSGEVTEQIFNESLGNIDAIEKIVSDDMLEESSAVNKKFRIEGTGTGILKTVFDKVVLSRDEDVIYLKQGDEESYFIIKNEGRNFDQYYHGVWYYDYSLNNDTKAIIINMINGVTESMLIGAPFTNNEVDFNDFTFDEEKGKYVSKEQSETDEYYDFEIGFENNRLKDISFKYNQNDAIIEAKFAFGYDESGKIVKVVVNESNGEISFETIVEYEFDSIGRVIKENISAKVVGDGITLEGTITISINYGITIVLPSSYSPSNKA